MNIGKKVAAVALLAVSLMITGCGEGKVGAVDVEKVMAEAPRVKTLMTEAQNEVTEAQQKFEQDTANKELSEEEATKVQADFQRKLENINKKYATRIKNSMDEKVAEVSREKNIDVVINNPADQKLIFHGAIDITQDIINKMQ